MPNLDKREKPIINLLKKNPYSYSEMEDLTEQSHATFSRGLKTLKEKKYIETYTPKDLDFKGKFKYRISEKYHKEEQEEKKGDHIHILISTELKSKSLFQNIQRFFQTSYSTISFGIYDFTLNEILLDTYAYLNYFNLNIDRIVGNRSLFINGILYLISSHPDQKYVKLKEKIKYNPLEFRDLISKFKKDRSAYEFGFKNPNSSSKEMKYFLIAEDPLLFNLKQKIETIFEKFLICWEFPKIQFEKHFDFFQNYSHHIFKESFSGIDPNRSEINFFFQKFKMCLLTFIRSHLMNWLEELHLTYEKEPPLNVLPVNEKRKLRRRILLSYEAIPTNEKENLKQYFLNQKIDREERHEQLVQVIKKLAKKISDNYEKETLNSQKKNFYLKNHLLLLLRIFQEFDLELYKKFQKSKTMITKFEKIRFSYSQISREIYKNLKRTNFGLKAESDLEQKSFTIRFLLERIDHLLNKIDLEDGKNKEAIREIKSIFQLASDKFSEAINFQFLKKKLEIYKRGYNFVKDNEIFQILQCLIQNYPRNLDLARFIFIYLMKPLNLERGHNLIGLMNLKISEKVHVIKNYVDKIPIDFNVEEYLGLPSSFRQIKDNYSSREPRREGEVVIDFQKKGELITLVKILEVLAKYYERNDHITDSFILYLIILKLELKIPRLFSKIEISNIAKKLVEIYSKHLKEREYQELLHKEIIESFVNFIHIPQADKYENENIKKRFKSLSLLAKFLEDYIEEFIPFFLGSKSKKKSNRIKKSDILKTFLERINRRRLDDLFNVIRIIKEQIINISTKIDDINQDALSRLEIDYSHLGDRNDYAFNIIFRKKYQIPEDWNFEKWETLFNSFEGKPLKKIDVLDIFLYSKIDIHFPKALEQISLLILNQYGIFWTIEYIECYINYLKWYLKRLDNERIFSMEKNVQKQQILEFTDLILNLVKTVIYWEFRKRTMAEDYIEKTIEILENLEKKNKNLFKISILNEYKKKIYDLKSDVLDFSY